MAQPQGEAGQSEGGSNKPQLMLRRFLSAKLKESERHIALALVIFRPLKRSVAGGTNKPSLMRASLGPIAGLMVESRDGQPLAAPDYLDRLAARAAATKEPLDRVDVFALGRLAQLLALNALSRR